MSKKVEFSNPGDGDGVYRNPFVTLDCDGNLVDRRIPTPADVRTIFSDFKRADSSDAERRGTLQNMFDLNLPYDPEKLKKLTLGNIANFNSGELTGFINSRVGVIAKLALDTVPLVELRPLPGQLAGPDADRFSEIIADEFSTTVRDENTLLPTLESMFKECDLFGLGPVTWSSRVDYLPVALRRGQIKFDRKGSIHSKNHEVFMFEVHVPIHFFRHVFDNEETAEKEGWVPKAIREYLVDVFVHEKDTEGEAGDSTGTTTLESALIEMRQHRWMETNQFRTVGVYHTLVKETDGKIRHTMSTPQAGIEQWLYDRPGAYESMNECFAWMPASVVEHEAAGSRGVASLMAPIADINNRLLCQMYNVGFRTGNITLVSSSPTTHSASSIQEFGPYTVVTQDLQFPQKPPSSNSQLPQLASLRELGSNIGLNNATGIQGGAAKMSEKLSTGSERKTKEQAIQEGNARDQGEQALFAARTLVLDQVFRETFRRFTNIIKGPAAVLKKFPEVNAFIDRCVIQGIPEEALKDMSSLFGVYTNRILVTGGGQAHAGILSGLLGSFGGAFDEKGRRLMTRDIVRYQLGTKSADRYSPHGTRDSAPSDATSLAALENSAMLRGDPAVVGMDQYHWTHIPVHMSILQQISKVYREAPDRIQEPQQTLDVLQAVSNHVQQHLAIGGQQPGMKEKASVVSKQLSSMAPIIKGLTMMAGTIERQREAEQKRQQEEMEALRQKADSQETAVAMHDINKKAELKIREQDLMQEARLKKVEYDREIKLLEAEADTKRQISRDTARMEQGTDAMGRDTIPIDAAPFPVGDIDALTGEDDYSGVPEYQ